MEMDRKRISKREEDKNMTEQLFPTKILYPKAPPIDIYIVVAYWTPGGWWKVFPEQHTFDDTAQKFADSLGSGWGERRMYHLK